MKHQSHAMNDLNSKKFLASQWLVGEENKFNLYSSPLSPVQPAIEDIEKLDSPSNRKPSTCMLHCSCDGLVLLSIADRLLVWNPSTGESIELPRLEYTREGCTYGLGYDSTSDDYKILKYHFDGSEILALKSGSWRNNIKCRVGFEPSLNLPVDSLAFLHGAFHWVCYIQKIFVVTFSISDEVFGKMQLLEPMLEKVHDFTGVSILGGMLCFYCAYSNPSESTFKLWLMKDYSVEESWILLYTIQDNDLFFLKPIQDKDLLDLFFLRPIHMFADGEVLLNYRCIDHVGSNLPFRTSKGPFGLWPGNNILKQGIIYTVSLISPKSLI